MNEPGEPNRDILKTSMILNLQSSSASNLTGLTLNIDSNGLGEDLSYSHEYLLTLAGIFYNVLGDSLFRDFTEACGVYYTSSGLQELDIRIMSEEGEEIGSIGGLFEEDDQSS